MSSALAKEIRALVDLYCSEPGHREAMLCALGQPGFVLHPEAPRRAGTLTLEVYQAISGALSIAAIQGAAGVELQMEAAYLFDRVADRETGSGQGLSAAEELALAITMQTCGAAAACEAVHRAKGNGVGLRPLLLLFENCVRACAGQFMDARLEKRNVATTDEALNMTSLKAGSLGRFAAEFGAGLATDETETIRLCGDLGFNLLTYAQLMDDLRDACPVVYAEGDLARHKKTLPLVFFYDSLLKSSPPDGEVRTWASSGEGYPDTCLEFERSGARVFSAIIAEVFLNRAKSNLVDLRGRVVEVKGLEDLLDSLVGSSARTVVVS
ncbi:MAG: polyprenyl synthetase family protein [Chloroflexi bacterium]|nr:polyprenyl synthetase family protein [Chloroflexota bacterium]